MPRTTHRHRNVKPFETIPAEEFERKRGVTDVKAEDNLTHVVVPIAADLQERLRVFQTLASSGISVFFIKLHPDSIHFVVRGDLGKRAAQVLQESLSLKPKLTPNCSLVSVISSAMRDLPGVMSRIAEAVHENGIELLETGDSHDSVVLLIRRKDTAKAVKSLKAKFDL